MSGIRKKDSTGRVGEQGTRCQSCGEGDDFAFIIGIAILVVVNETEDELSGFIGEIDFSMNTGDQVIHSADPVVGRLREP